MRLLLESGAARNMTGHLRRCLPEEGCGFLVGRGETASRFVPAPNSLGSRMAWAVRPGFLFDLSRELRLTGESLLGICHSHPAGDARLSEDDIEAAAGHPDAFHVVVSFRSEAPEIRAWRILDGEAREAELHATI